MHQPERNDGLNYLAVVRIVSLVEPLRLKCNAVVIGSNGTQLSSVPEKFEGTAHFHATLQALSRESKRLLQETVCAHKGRGMDVS